MWLDVSDWRRRRILGRHAIADSDWEQARVSHPALECLEAGDAIRLRELATLFLHDKRIVGAHAFPVTPERAATVAAQACLPVLNLGLRWLRRWTTVVLYETDFVTRHTFEDDDGLLHEGDSALTGEAWDHGPVILSWEDIALGSPVVFHEIAHTLDMLNGDSNGFPPMHADMRRDDWVQTFSDYYAELCDRLESDSSADDSVVDPYASESPAECFAVLSETFFANPVGLRQVAGPVYRQLQQFYRQDPATRAQHAPGLSAGSPVCPRSSSASKCST